MIKVDNIIETKQLQKLPDLKTCPAVYNHAIRIVLAISQFYEDVALEEALEAISSEDKTSVKLRQFIADLNRFNKGINMHYEREFGERIALPNREYKEAY